MEGGFESVSARLAGILGGVRFAGSSAFCEVICRKDDVEFTMIASLKRNSGVQVGIATAKSKGSGITYIGNSLQGHLVHMSEFLKCCPHTHLSLFQELGSHTISAYYMGESKQCCLLQLAGGNFVSHFGGTGTRLLPTNNSLLAQKDTSRDGCTTSLPLLLEII